jgi:hypothetical protein
MGAISQKLDYDFRGPQSYGDAPRRVSHQVPRSPSTPPPPYSLFDITSPAENFALAYHPMPMPPSPTLPSIGDRSDSAPSIKRKRTTDVASDHSERQRKRAR